MCYMKNGRENMVRLLAVMTRGSRAQHTGFDVSAG